ncbi:hypothetical protein OSB04_021453 [Centaurea solstitialis]|uniref:RING-type E3 ubiquitin transferase n=1 Tax=Centaurea solstitialis TaxID=347529 RepID=A0AA38SU78_9ASTR|nr:hypothetical protein OSB04_021453 [Centaurea solstitialis]
MAAAAAAAAAEDSTAIAAATQSLLRLVFCLLSELTAALKGAKSLILSAGSFDHSIYSDGAAQKIAFQFQDVTWKLERALSNLPYDRFDISEEVKEQVDLVKGQLKRATARYGGPQDSIVISCGLSEPLAKEPEPLQPTNVDHHGFESKVGGIPNESLPKDADEMIHPLELKTSDVGCTVNNIEENKKVDSPVIPDDFLCPISLELFRILLLCPRDRNIACNIRIILQTYERSYIQRWINCGNTTCPKTQQKLKNFILTPNYVLRSLITRWCTNHNVEQPTLLTNRKLKNSDGSFLDVSRDIDVIESIVHNLSSPSIEERRAAVSEIRSLSKRSTNNRILIAEAGAIPILIDLLSSEDKVIQEHAVTSILNLSIYENNRGLIMLANAVPSIVEVLKAGSMETRENAAATLFSLSLADENKIIIGASGAIPALVDLLENGSQRGKNDAATALFNLCIYQGNKGRAVRAGIMVTLLRMLTESGGSMVDESMTILSVLASHQEAKAAMVRAGVIPNLVNQLTVGIPRNKENAASILVSLCKRDDENLACLSSLAAVAPLVDLATNGTERGKRKANSLLAQLERLRQQLEHV